MKKKPIDLDVDFIGEQGYSPTEEEFKEISDFIRLRKALNQKALRQQGGIPKRQKSINKMEDTHSNP